MLSAKTDAQSRGAAGEAAAAAYLESQGLKVRERHYFTRWGEIDLICQDRDETWVFVEVKTRARFSSPSAVEALTPAKQKKIIGTALSFMKKRGLKDQAMRFDVITMEENKIDWIPGAFESTVAYTY